MIQQGSLLEDLQTLFGRELHGPDEVGPERDDRSAGYVAHQLGSLEREFSFLEQEIRLWETIAWCNQTRLSGEMPFR